MLTLDDLKAKAQHNPTDRCKDEIAIMINSDADVKDVINGMSKYFGEDDKRQAVRLIVEGEEIGCLVRSDLYDFIPLSKKGIDDSGNAQLPGNSKFRLVQFYCPYCTNSQTVMIYGEASLPKCHDRVMKIKK